MPGLGPSSGMPPPLSVPQRGLSATLENAARGSSFMRRTSIDGGQVRATFYFYVGADTGVSLLIAGDTERASILRRRLTVAVSPSNWRGLIGISCPIMYVRFEASCMCNLSLPSPTTCSIAIVLSCPLYAQILPPVLTRKWESSPDFKVFLGKSGGSTSRTAWGTPLGSGRSLIAGPPSFGSPGRSELARGIKISSPQLQSQVRLSRETALMPNARCSLS